MGGPQLEKGVRWRQLAIITIMKLIKLTLLGLLLAGLSTAPLARAEDAPAAAKPKPYTLKVCPVSDEKLGGDMGEAFVFVYGKTKDSAGREIKLCCKSCQKDFDKNPKKYLKKIDTAEAKEAKEAKAKKS